MNDGRRRSDCLVPSPLVEGRWINSINGLRRPSAIALTSNGDAIVAETEYHCIKLITSSGDTAMTITMSSLCHPYCVAVAKDDLVLVVDSQGQQIHSLTLDGHRETLFTNKLSKCYMEWPVGITTGCNDNVYVLDRNSHRIHVFDPSLNFLSSFGNKGVLIGQMKFPSGIASDCNGVIYVADSLNHRVQKFTEGGDCVASFGSYGCKKGYLNQLTALSIDSHGIVYVAEMGNHRISLFTYDGQFLGCYGEWGVSKGQLRCPCSLAVSSDQSKLYVCDYLNNRVQIF